MDLATPFVLYAISRNIISTGLADLQRNGNGTKGFTEGLVALELDFETGVYKLGQVGPGTGPIPPDPKPNVPPKPIQSKNEDVLSNVISASKNDKGGSNEDRQVQIPGFKTHTYQNFPAHSA